MMTSASKMRGFSKLGLLSVAMVALLSACGEHSSRNAALPRRSEEARTVEEALPHLRRIVEATAASALSEFVVQPDTDEVTACEDPVGQDTEALSAPYGVRFALSPGTDVAGLFSRVRSYWEAQGFEVASVDLSSDDPTMFGQAGEYDLTLHIVKETRMGYLSGSTPCLPSAGL